MKNIFLKQDYKISTMFLALFFVSSMSFALPRASHCHPAIDSHQDHYIIAYGSLMSEQSKQSTVTELGENLPVMLKGYQRGWFLKGAGSGFAGTFLGVKAAKHHQINAVIFQVPKPDKIMDFDKRESGYCRRLVREDAMSLQSKGHLPKGQYWIYLPQRSKMALASQKFPIMQSYVDIFLSACLQLENKYQLKDYAKQCIKTTSDWSSHWVNDRIYPRRPWTYEPKALAIDKLLSEQVPQYFKNITIE